MDVTIINHPLALARLTTMRDERSTNAQFRAALQELAQMLVYEAARDLPVEDISITTPLTPTTGHRLLQPPLIVPVIRAGLGMVDAALSMIPDAQVGFVGMARDEETHQPVPYLEALPDDLSQQNVFVIDPMLATGGSMLHTLKLIVDRGARVDQVFQARHAQPRVAAGVDVVERRQIVVDVEGQLDTGHDTTSTVVMRHISK